MSINHQFDPKTDVRTFLEAGLPELFDLGLAFVAAGLVALVADLVFALTAAAFAATFTQRISIRLTSEQ